MGASAGLGGAAVEELDEAPKENGEGEGAAAGGAGETGFSSGLPKEKGDGEAAGAGVGAEADAEAVEAG